MEICNCKKSSRKVKTIGQWDGAALNGKRHTNFSVQVCECGKLTGFPEFNFKLAIEKGTENTRARLKQIQQELSEN